jgi:signal transduction histidine kinase
MTRSFDTFRADVVRRLYEVISRVNSSADLHDVLQEIAQGVVEGLGYGVAAISRLEGDTLVMSTVAGDMVDLGGLIGRRTPAENVLGREFSIADHWGILRFVPHDRLPPEQIESLWVPDLEITDDPSAWHPLDALYAPLYSSTGELLGNMAVDLPPESKIPNQEQRELLEMFAVQAGLALENAQRRDSLSRQVRLGEALKHLALLAGRVDLRSALEEAVASLSGALSVAQVTVRCFADNVEDHEDYAVGAPNPGRAEQPTVDQIRADLVRHAVAGTQRPLAFSLPDDDFRDLESAPVLREQAERFGWSHGLLAPVGVDREVLGYLVLLRDETQPRFEPEEVDAVHEAGRELGRLVRDVRLRRTERRLLAEMRELDRYKGELIATISHELKTPLTSIIGHTELLEEAGVQPTSVGAISRNAARLDRLVTNLLNYSRIQGRRELQRVSLDLGEACHASLEMLRIQAQTADVELHLVEPEAPVRVLGDAEELPRVIDNLCSNAVKYTPAGGRIEVSVGAVDGRGEVRVADTGLGISSQDQVHLFSAFHRSTNPQALTIPGTGLGLAISRTIAELHGGDITVESELGRGSVFTLRIPIAEETATSA